MSQKNDFKALSVSNNKNVVSQEKYGISSDLQTEFPSDDVHSHWLNKALH